mmetsp:Transcript_85685/g.228449  ORF Transcript_85685/g.228449 Transcript_85685/m.228449 type:complete len:209 (+) Transcript_85685:133-759(+)|eukprot:CAMPEP_0113695932 /NCGR_PEP_ID=MMETSP0038_2-20120614/21192_1 /TAXON_ID=2898 /ORGANISM="Cryptomonas paramecium" /LENGTH=208 /DNA_ID=CAMNT_0000618565 /DNA_START=138 /DNA_END=764 /DNA_ORIENTATION=- /assembly_acc=CAM_ASM_000170
MAGCKRAMPLLSRALKQSWAPISRSQSFNYKFVSTTSFQRAEAAEAKKKPFDNNDDSMSVITGKTPKKIVDLVDQIVALNMVEVTELVELLKVKLNLQGVPLGGAMMMPGAGMAPAGGAAAPAGGAPAAEKKEEKKEKTEFTLKLDSFNAADKLKVIKEIRTITGLGLKESKDMVEGAPKVVKEGLTKEDADKFKKVLEEAGGKVSIA